MDASRADRHRNRGSDPALCETGPRPGTEETSTTVAVIDPDERTRSIVDEVARTMGHRCFWTGTSRTLLEVLTEHQPACLILEAALEAGDPSLLHRRVTQHCAARSRPAPPTIFVSALGSVPAAVRALRAGALHFLEKPLGIQEVWDAVSEGLTIHRERRREWEQRRRIEERAARLNDADWHLLSLLCDGFSKQRIAASLGVCIRTLEIRRKRLMQKLEAESIVDVVRFGIRDADWRECRAAMTGDISHPIKAPRFLSDEPRAAAASDRSERGVTRICESDGSNRPSSPLKGTPAGGRQGEDFGP